MSQLFILYGTESGNSEALAESTQDKASKLGINSEIHNLADFKLKNLTNINKLLVIISTWGEGDPPEGAESFYKDFMSNNAPKLKNTRFSVLGLGDTSYEHFCKMGKDFDSRLEELGGSRIYKRVDCDVDYDDDYAKWSDSVLGIFKTDAKKDLITKPVREITKPVVKYNRSNPLSAKLLDRINLNGKGSNKQTMHLEIDLRDSGLNYEVGDSLAVQPENSDYLIKSLLDTTNFNSHEEVEIKEEKFTLYDALKYKLDITTLSVPFVERFNNLISNKKLTNLIESDSKQDLKSYIEGRDLLDLISDFPINGVSCQDFLNTLRKMPPRLYSIASSQKYVSDEVHLTVAVVRYQLNGRNREGVCSTYLAERLKSNSLVDVFVTPNKNFKLPKDSDAPIIMVGPGTGIAPFRAFMQDRLATGSKGKNWLFFGDQHFLTDFLYQAEWQKYFKDGVLNRIDTAFSRDQAHKVYVQDKMRQNGKELFDWLDSGAYFYVCGDASRMAKDVDDALHEIVQKHGGFNEDKAIDYVKELKSNKRYLKDVY